MSQSESPHRQGNAKDILNKLGLHSKHAADQLTADDLRHAPTLAEEYRTYVSFAKTERKSASYFLEKAVERMLHKSQPSKEERRDGLVRWMLGQIRR